MLGQSRKSHELFRGLDAANETGHRLCTEKMMCHKAVIFKTGRKVQPFSSWKKMGIFCLQLLSQVHQYFSKVLSGVDV